MKQTDVILNHLKIHKSITPMEAHIMFRVRSLSRRINDLEAKGHLFIREWKKDTTGQRYTRYYYLGQAVTTEAVAA